MVSRIYRFLMVSVSVFFLLGFPQCPTEGAKIRGTSPEWTSLPSDVTALAGEGYAEINGRAKDSDLPNSSFNSPGRLKCYSKNRGCSFYVKVEGTGEGQVDCRMSFKPPITGDSCNIKVVVEDGTGNTIVHNVAINVKNTLDISECSPNPANEGSNVSCVVKSDIGVPVVNMLADTCGGTINGAGPYSYDFVAGEPSGPAGCNAAVYLATNTSIKDEEFVAVNEINLPPTLIVDCPASMDEGAEAECILAPLDPDLPDSAAGDPGFVSCSLDSSNTCPGAILIGCEKVTLPATIDPSIGSCSVVVDITDGYSAIGQGSDTITINNLCYDPIITNLPHIYSGHWGNPGNFDVDVSDADIPLETHTFTLENNTCSFTPTVDGASGLINWTCGNVENCSVDVRAVDQCPSGALSDVETLYIECNNTAPVFTTTAPAPITENIPYTYNILCSDTDGDILTLSTSPSHSCPGVFTPTGNGAGQFTLTPDETMGNMNCVLGLSCTDTVESLQQNTSFTIVEDNQTPFWNPSAADIWAFVNEQVNYHWGHADDADIPPQTITCAKTGQTCSIPLTVSGSGAGGTDCNFQFTGPASAEVCEVSVAVSDGAGGVINQTIPVHIINAPCIFFVDLNAAGAGTGMSWTDAYTTVQEAVNRASQACPVWVREGVYKTGDTAPVLTMKDGISVYGGFDTTETSPADRDLAANSTVLDGELLDKRVVIGASSARLDGFDIVNSRSSLIGGGFYSSNESGLYIDKCDFSENKTDNSGGAMANFKSSLTISNSTFTDNNAYYYYYMVGNGGGIYNLYSNNTITDSKFYRNNALYSGGGIFNNGGNLFISNSIFAENKTDKNHGGAIFTRDTQFTLDNGTFNNNTALRSGGGICSYGTNSYIYDSSFYKNNNLTWRQGAYYYNDYRGGYGGGIADFNSSLYLQGSVFYSNSAISMGGGLAAMNSPTDTYIYDNYFGYNDVGLYGGGLAFSSAGKQSLVISNNIFSENTAEYPALPGYGSGGGAVIACFDLALSNNYFYDNQASRSGAGIYAVGDGLISNSVFKNNSGYIGGGISLNVTLHNYNHKHKFDIINDLIVNNSADGGGGIFFRSTWLATAEINIINCTIANNDSTLIAGGVLDDGDNSKMYISNSILYFNWAPQIIVTQSESSASITYSDIQMAASSLYTGNGNINENPLFVGASNYHLSHLALQGVDSPCINTADPFSSLFGTTRTDSAPDAARLDMGFHFPLP